MSKTVELQIEKGRNLVEGLRRHVKEMGERGISNAEINQMEQSLNELTAANEVLDNQRASKPTNCRLFAGKIVQLFLLMLLKDRNYKNNGIIVC